MIYAVIEAARKEALKIKEGVKTGRDIITAYEKALRLEYDIKDGDAGIFRKVGMGHVADYLCEHFDENATKFERIYTKCLLVIGYATRPIVYKSVLDKGGYKSLLEPYDVLLALFSEE